MKLLISFLATVGAQQPDSNGSCLLQKFNRTANGKLIQKVHLTDHSDLQSQSMTATLNQQHKWRVHHMSLVSVVNKSKSLLDEFIESQASSKAACSSRLLEAKRVLDGLLKDVETLNSQVLSKEEIVETETQNLEISKQSIEAAKTEYKEEIKRCMKERKEAIEEYKIYRKELIELRQIAMPSTRYDHAVKVHSNSTHTEVSQNERLAIPGSSLLQVSFDREMCLAFVKFAQEHKGILGDALGLATERGCDEKREELQKAFTEAYIDVTHLKSEARARALDKTCYQSAKIKLSAELVPLISQRDAFAERITVASGAISLLTPVMHEVKGKAESLKKHISETLTPECKEAEEASDLLVQVRKLILSLEKCPGRNDFSLEVPSKEQIMTAIQAMEDEADKEENENSVLQEEDKKEEEERKTEKAEEKEEEAEDLTDKANATETEDASTKAPTAVTEESDEATPAPEEASTTG